MSQLLNIFLDPAKVFAEQKEKPTFLVPALVVTFATVAAMLMYFLTVDPDWFSAHQLAQIQAAKPEITKAELEQMAAFMPGARASAIWVGIFTPVTLVFIYLLMAVYYLLAGKVSGAPVSFRHGLALTAWASMPLVLNAVVIIAGVLTSPSDTPLESLQMLNVDPLFVSLPIESPWSSLAKSFSLLNFWCWFLAALGWKTWSRGGWGGALAVVLLPSVVFYGIWALIAAL